MKLFDHIACSGRPWRPMRCYALLGLAAVACWGAGWGVAFADSGDAPETTDGVTSYILPKGSCGELQTIVGRPIEFALACSIGGRVTNADTPCDIVTFVNNTQINAGLALGQCLTDLYPNPLLAIDPNSNVLKANTQILNTAAGNNVAFGDRDQISITNGASVQGYVDVMAGSCTSGECAPSCNGLDVVQSQAACDEVEFGLQQSVTADPPALSHVAFFDLSRNGTTSGSITMKVAVCNGYEWTCRNPGAEVVPSDIPGTKLANTTYEGQVPVGITNTPACLRFTRTTRC